MEKLNASRLILDVLLIIMLTITLQKESCYHSEKKDLNQILIILKSYLRILIK